MARKGLIYRKTKQPTNLGVIDQVCDLCKWKHVVLTEIEDVVSKKFELQIFLTLKINEFHLQ